MNKLNLVQLEAIEEILYRRSLHLVLSASSESAIINSDDVDALMEVIRRELGIKV